MFFILHFPKELICELKNRYHFIGARAAVQGRKTSNIERSAKISCKLHLTYAKGKY